MNVEKKLRGLKQRLAEAKNCLRRGDNHDLMVAVSQLSLECDSLFNEMQHELQISATEGRRIKF